MIIFKRRIFEKQSLKCEILSVLNFDYELLKHHMLNGIQRDGQFHSILDRFVH